MAFKERYPTKFQSLWGANYFSKASIPPLAGKILAWTPRINLSPATILAGGVTHIAVNTGDKGPAVPVGNRAIFVENPNMIKGYAQQSLGGKPLYQFSEAECKECAQYIVNQCGPAIGVFTTGLSEYDASNLPWAKVTYANGETFAAPSQYDWIDKELARLVELGGGRFFGDYDGHGGAANQTSDGFGVSGSEALRPAFLIDSSAYDVLHTYSASGGGNTFFKNDMYQFRDGIVKTYWNGSVSGSKRMYEIMTNLILSRRALNFKGSTRKLLSFAWAGRQEFINRLEEYKQVVPAGGEVRDIRFPPYSERIQTAIGYISMALAEGLYMWEDTDIHGTNPNVVKANNPDNAQYSYTGSGATLVPSKTFYQEGAQYPYPISFDSGHNAMLQGVEFWSRAVQWAGNTVNYAPYRTLGGTYATTGKDYILNSYQQGKPFAFLHATGNKRALFVLDMHRSAGTYMEYEFDCGGATKVVSVEGQRPYLFLGEV